MVSMQDFGDFETAWCPGCGNFSILDSVKKALVKRQLQPRDVLFVSGIGQAAKAPLYLNVNVFDGLHGRTLPVATAAKLVNPALTVIVESGDGCSYGEGGNHFLAAIRRNPDITVLVHDNQVYGLTKGQASPTSQLGFVTKAQPDGVQDEPFKPLAVALALRASFVARGFSGESEHLTDLIASAIGHRGFSLVDILHPCVSFNHVNTFGWYKKRCYKLAGDHDPSDWDTAMKLAHEWEERIPLGILYQKGRPVMGETLPPVLEPDTTQSRLKTILATYM